ncbi:T3SS effector HopA1 family protein [Micromonospora sp. CPCC 206060]|uniref:T3SS effector HopA1 family protein n=1 Tax=Micromonospora sp. CPCC 206060 TaxID=3122406 RepID=UPI002FF113D4
MVAESSTVVPESSVDDTLMAALTSVGVLSATRIYVGGELVEAAGPRALVPALTAALYSALHVGKAYDSSTRPNLRDPALEGRLAAALPHLRTPVRARVLEDGDDCVVELLGVRVLVPADRVGARNDDGTATISLDAARPTLSPGFFLCDGSVGSITGTGPILRIYLHLSTADHAPQALAAGLGVLESRQVPYRAKILSLPNSYPRRDTMVVYLEETAWPVLDELVTALSGVPGLVDATSPFARRVGPGIAVAWDPMDGRVGMRALSFGEHRARMTAEAVVDHAVQGVPLADAVAAAFVRGGADPGSPFRNTTSPHLPWLDLA